MQEFDEIWEFTVEELRKDYSDTFISFWFKELKIVALSDTHAVVFVPSTFKRNMIEKNHSSTVESALERVLGYRLDVEFTLNADYDPQSAPIISTPSETVSHTVEQTAPSVSPTVNQSTDVHNAEQTVKVTEEPTFFTSTEPENLAEASAHSSEYTFENFIVGSSNKFAHSVSLSVATHPACLQGQVNTPIRTTNPLFIYGPSGLGKTHLLYAIINQIRRDYPYFHVVYVKGEEFTNQMIESIATGQTAEFREKYRKADVLLIDDIHFIAGKESTQEEFFHTFNDLYEHKKQIILTSDRSARDIQHLEERLRTRFEWGMMADIQPPDFELRVAIMDKKAEALGMTFSKEVLTYLAEKLTNNVRQMEGAIKKIIAYSQLIGAPVTVSLVNSCIADLLSNNGSVKITPDAIVERVAEKYGVSKSDIYSKKKTNSIAKARHICIYLFRKMLDMSYPAIGDVLNRDHTTAMHSFTHIERDIKNDSSFEIEINELIKQFHTS